MWNTNASDQTDPDRPQQHRARQQVPGHVAQRLAVEVDLLLREVQLEVADQVREHEAHEDDAGDGHHPFLADRAAVERARPAGPPRRRAPDRRDAARGGWWCVAPCAGRLSRSSLAPVVVVAIVLARALVNPDSTLADFRTASANREGVHMRSARRRARNRASPTARRSAPSSTSSRRRTPSSPTSRVGSARGDVAMTTDSMMTWFSMTKAVTAVAVAQQWERGALDLDDAGDAPPPRVRRARQGRASRSGTCSRTPRASANADGDPARARRGASRAPTTSRGSTRHRSEYEPGTRAGYHAAAGHERARRNRRRG